MSIRRKNSDSGDSLGLGIYAMSLKLALDDFKGSQRFKRRELSIEEKEIKRQKKVKANQSSLALANGLKPFDINGITVYAINKKNAEKKYNKLVTNKSE